MHRSFPLAALVLLASGCLGGTAAHPAPHMVTVPDVAHPPGDPTATGVSADAAGAELRRVHLRLAIAGPFQVSSFWGEPLVVRQSPAAGARVPAGTPVRLVIRQEPGAAICPAHRHVISDVVGDTLAQAERTLEVAFFGTMPPLPPSGVTRWEDAYRVSSQSVPAGARVAACTSIRLRLRLG